MTIKAFQFVEWQQPGQLRDVPVPEPGPGEVLIKVGGAGACHSDLHLLELPAGARSFTLPFTLGHENAGWVETMGPGATGFAPGDPVIVYGPWGCGLCMNCRQGMENYCQTPGKPSPGGLGGTDGGMAEYLLVPSTRYLIPLGDLDPREAAPLTDAGLTSYHAVKRSVHLLGPGSTAVVIGAGGLGQMAIQVLKALGSATTVVAVDTSEDKLKIAKKMGADEVLISGDDAVKRIKDITKGQGAELVLDLVGVNPTLTHGRTGGPGARAPHHRRSRQRGPAGQLLQPTARMLCRVTVLGLHPRADRGDQPRPDRQDQDARRTLRPRRCGARLPPAARRQDPGTRRHHTERLTARDD